MELTIDSVAYDVLRNVLISNAWTGRLFCSIAADGTRSSRADLLERPGAIFGGDQMVEWTSIGKKRRYTFRNPQHVLYDRMAAVKLLADNTPVDGRVVFTCGANFPKENRRTCADRRPHEGISLVDRNRGNVVAAFADVWSHIKKNAHHVVGVAGQPKSSLYLSTLRPRSSQDPRHDTPQ